MHEMPDFLDLPERTSKPRTGGITHVLDKGMTLASLDGLFEQAVAYIDVVKLGWGLGYIDPHLGEREIRCRLAGVNLCLGGTFLELAVAQRRVPEMVRWAHNLGVRTIEVSNGLSAISRAEKTVLVRQLSSEFVVLAETGAKDSQVPVEPQRWVAEMEADLEAGASHVIAEGRESGTVGLYRADGSPRSDVADAIAARIPLERVIFEAPSKSHQTWLIQRFGANVGLGNIRPEDVLALETLRLGLRADTALVEQPVEATAW